MFQWFHKTLPINAFYVLLVTVLHLAKRTRNIYTQMLEFTFPGDNVIFKRGICGQGGDCNKYGWVESIKIFI